MPPVASRYAEAIFSLSVQNNAVDEYQEELTVLSGIYETESGFKAFLLSPGTNVQTKKRILTNLFEGKVGPSTLNFLLLLLDKDRIKYLPEICRQYIRMADEQKNVLHITIMTAIPLEQEYIDRICEKFKTSFHSVSVKASVQTDPSLIGGVKVAVGDKLYDGTIKGKLSKLRSVLSVQ